MFSLCSTKKNSIKKFFTTNWYKSYGKKYLLKVLEVKSESESIVNLKPIKSTTSGKSGHKPAKRSTGSKYLLITDFNKFRVENNARFDEIDSRFNQMDSRFDEVFKAIKDLKN